MKRLLGYHQGFARSAGESANPDLWKGLVGAWLPAFGNTGSKLFDLSGKGNHGTLTNMAADDWVGGHNGFALDFDGVNDYVAVGSGVWNSDGPVTFTFWTNVDPTNANGFGGHAGAVSSTDRLQVHCPYSDGTLYWDYGDIAGNGRLSASYSGYGNKWTHVALTSEGASGSGMKIYLDGIEVASSGVSDGPSGAINFDVGRFHRTDDTDFYHKGMIESVYLYLRSLSASEVSQLYTNTYAMFEPAINPALFYVAAVGGLSIPIAMHHRNQMSHN